MLRRPRTLLLVAAVTLTGWLLAAGAADAKTPGIAGGGGGMFGILGLPSVGDIVKKVASKIFGALADALLPDFIKEAPDKLVTWLATLPNPTGSDSAVYSLMTTTRATGFAFLIVVLLYGGIRGMVPGQYDHPITVLGRVVGVSFFLVIWAWTFNQVIALFNTISVGLLHNDIVKQGIGDTITRAFSPETIGATPLNAVMVLIALFILLGLLVVKLMTLYLIPVFFDAMPLIAPLWVPRETAHIPRVMLQMFGSLVAIPAGWTILFGVAGALSGDMAAGRVDGGGLLTSDFLAPLTTICIFALACWWPWAVLGIAKQLPSQLGIATSKGPMERASGLAGTAMKLKMAAAFAGGGIGALGMAGAAGKSGAGPRLAADGPSSSAGTRSRVTDSGSGPPSTPGAAGTRPTGTGSPATDSPAQTGPAAADAAGGRGAASRETSSSTTPASGPASAPPQNTSPGPAGSPSPAGRDQDPLRPGAPPSGAGQPTPGDRSRDAAHTAQGGRAPSVTATAPVSGPAPSNAAPDAPSRPSAPSAPSGRPAAPTGTRTPSQRPSAAPATGAHDVPGSRAAAGPSPSSQPRDVPRPAQDANAKTREATQPTASDLAGLPSRDIDTARDAFGKDPA